MFKIENNIAIAVILYLLLISIIIYLKPRIIFTKDSRIKRFGTGQNKTLYPFWLVAIIIGILSYYLVLMYNIVKVY